MKRRYLDLFAACGVEPQRLELLPPSSYAEYLAAYSQVDVALDPFPFSGSATTCEALWMGVPVITCPGETFASRHSLSHLSNVGLTETIARDLDEYVELAVSLAGDLPRLAGHAGGLRQRMAASPLCDGQRFAANLMRALLRDVWRAVAPRGGRAAIRRRRGQARGRGTTPERKDRAGGAHGNSSERGQDRAARGLWPLRSPGASGPVPHRRVERGPAGYRPVRVAGHGRQHNRHVRRAEQFGGRGLVVA